jgi:cyclic 2,3-diphosphoglycerate synthetase
LRILALVDGEHYPPVVRAALEHLPPGLVGVVLLGGQEKLRHGLPDLGVPLVTGPTPQEALIEGIRTFHPDEIHDLADEPVLDPRTRMRLAAWALISGATYVGADFRFDPPHRPHLATKPSIAVIGSGKRTGKTAVAGALARLLKDRGTPPVIVAMGRGGPLEPEVIDPTNADLTPEGLLALADSGRHAASDHLEDALTAGVVTIGTRRCGGGLAGAPADSTFAAGVTIANERPEASLIFEGSGSAIPPAHADATICVVPATADPELVTGYLGPYRMLLADLVVVTMAEQSLADSGAVTSLERDVRGLAPGGVVRTVFRPFPLEPISGRRIFYATTATPQAMKLMVRHLEDEHGGKVVGTSPHLSNRRLLEADLEAAGDAEALVVELKAAAIDLATRVALERGWKVIFSDNRVVSVGGDGSFDELATGVADLASDRFHR